MTVNLGGRSSQTQVSSLSLPFFFLIPSSMTSRNVRGGNSILLPETLCLMQQGGEKSVRVTAGTCDRIRLRG